MKTSTLLINNHIYEVKDTKLREDYPGVKDKFDDKVEEAREINDTVTKGKKLIAETISNKNVITEPEDTFETMADNISKIKSNVGFTPPANQYIVNKTEKVLSKFICEYPYRYYTAIREASPSDLSDDMVLMPVNYVMPNNIPTKISAISRVKRLEKNWNGVYIVGTFMRGSFVYNTTRPSDLFIIQLVSNTELEYTSYRRYETNSTDIFDDRKIEIPNIAKWEELVLEFKYEIDANNVINTSINIAQVEDDSIKEFIVVHSERLKLLDWPFSASSATRNGLTYLGSSFTNNDVAPSAVNMNDCAFVVNGKIYAGNTSLYPFPNDFTAD